MGQIDLKNKEKSPCTEGDTSENDLRLCGFLTGVFKLLLVQSFFQRFCQLVRT